MREIKFRAWDGDNNKMIYSHDTTIIGFWKWVSYDSTQEVMQYTGLHDKNEKEIYEGDILQNVTEEHYTVKWNHHRVQFESASSQGGYIPENIWCKSEVIGNIYENPDLIGGNNS